MDGQLYGPEAGGDPVSVRIPSAMRLPQSPPEWETSVNNRNSRYTTSSTMESDTRSRPNPSTVVPAAASKAAGRINAIAARVSIVAGARAPADYNVAPDAAIRRPP